MRIGVDFDNTIACYDEAFVKVGRNENILPTEFSGSTKSEVREAIRSLENGEHEWQRLQGLVYGRMINEAKTFAGVEKFFCKAIKHPEIEIFIVSHKTELAHHDPLKTNLRSSALSFLGSRDFFNNKIVGIDRNTVFFESTREEKIERIKALQCDVFIDDLPEVLLDSEFPENCKKILFAANSDSGLINFASWQEIEDYLFGMYPRVKPEESPSMTKKDGPKGDSEK